MRLLSAFLSFVFLAVAGPSNAQTVVQGGDGLKITIPETFTRLESNKCLYVGVNPEKDLLIISAANNDLETLKLMQNGDELLFNLAEYDYISNDSESFFNVGADYTVKEYAHYKTGSRLYTFTSYMYDYPYVILYSSHKTDSDRENFDKIISSVEDSGATFWHRLYLIFRRGFGVIFLAVILLGLLLSATQNNALTVLSVLIGALLFLPAWGDWAVYFAAVAIFALLLLCFRAMTPTSILESMASGI